MPCEINDSSIMARLETVAQYFSCIEIYSKRIFHRPLYHIPNFIAENIVIVERKYILFLRTHEIFFLIKTNFYIYYKIGFTGLITVIINFKKNA